MEIINYVGFENDRRRVNFPLKAFSSFKRRKNTAVSYSFSHTACAPVSAAGISGVSFNFKAALAAVGHAADFLIKHIMQIFYGICTAACCVLALFAVKNIMRYAFSYTGPLELADSDTAELDFLNKAMTLFALDEAADYSSDGDLLDAGAAQGIIADQIFRQPVVFEVYKVQNGDTISGITRKFGLKNISTLIAVNDIDNVRQLGAGQKLKIPSMDGLLYTVQKGNTLAGLSARFNVTIEDLLDVNELESNSLAVGQQLFIPGARLDSEKLHQALGDLFKNPLSVKYRLSSRFGWRADPFTGARSYHTGIDMACPQGSPVAAAMSGKVAFTGYSNVFGNYVIINHSNGYQTLYAHLSKIFAAKGKWISQGTRIGLVGSTGYSTGPHLHFTVYKNGKLVDPFSVLK